MSTFKIRQAVREIDQGKVIAYPTEAVFGLGCDPLNETAVLNLLALKKRSVEQGLILIASSLKQLEPYLQLTPSIVAKVEATWPGAVTWIIPSQPWVPQWLTGQYSSLAVRVTAHPIARLLCEEYAAPFVSTSANIHNKPPATQTWQVSKSLAGQQVFTLSGQVGGLKQTTPIYDVLSQQKIR